MTAPLVSARDLARIYAVRRGLFGARPAARRGRRLLHLASGKTLAVVGESGCGKSTLARLVTLIENPTPARSPSTASTRDAAGGHRHRLRRAVQIVFQNPYGSLNPRKKVGAILEEPLIINTDLSRAERRAKARAMMAKVGLRPEHYGRYPHMFSGGQRQRIAIARALML